MFKMSSSFKVESSEILGGMSPECHLLYCGMSNPGHSLVFSMFWKLD